MGPCLLRSCNPTKGAFHVVMEHFVASFGKEAPTDKGQPHRLKDFCYGLFESRSEITGGSGFRVID